MVQATANLTANLSLTTDSLWNANIGSGAGHIAFDANSAPWNEYISAVSLKKNEIADYIRLSLGDGIIDIEADQAHIDMAINQALIRYRQRSSNAVEESYAMLDLYPETQEYILPNEIIEVKSIFRRGIGSVTGTTASQFEPFASGYLNTYMLVAGRVGGLASYFLFSSYQELAMRMFGGYMNYTWNRATKKLTLVRKMPNMGQNPASQVSESVLLWVYNYKPDVVILNDHMAFPWIQEYAFAKVKMLIGEAREKFATINGPQGGTSLNGAALKAEAKETLDRLELELDQYRDGGEPMTWVIG